jgi:drug/metabolite transporter (DMT)-like permease
LNSALKRGELSFLLPLDFLKLIWSVIIGGVFFGEGAPMLLWLGGAFIIGAATLIVTAEKKF